MPDQQAGDKKKERFAAVGAMLLFAILFFAGGIFI
jgi:Mg2+/citrate symporter